MTGRHTFAIGAETNRTACPFCGRAVRVAERRNSPVMRLLEAGRLSHVPRCQAAERTEAGGSTRYRRRAA